MTIPQYSSRKLLAFAAVTLVVCSAPVFETQFLNDMEFYSLFADKILSGRLLYRDAMDTKPPLVFLHYAAVFKLFGLNNVTAVKVVTMGWLALSALLLAALRKTLSPGGAMPALAALVFILGSFSGWGEEFLSSNTEILANLFILMGIALLVARDFSRRAARLVAGGCCIGVACLYRYQSAAALGAYVATMLLRWRHFDGRFRRLFALGAGVTLPAAIVIAYYGRLGAISDLRLLLAYQSHYACDPDRFSWKVMLGQMLVATVGLGPVLALALSRAIEIAKRRAAASPSEIFQLAFAGCSVVPFFVGRRFFPHYFVQAIPSLVLLAVDRLAASTPRPRWLARYGLAILVLPAVVFTTSNGIYYDRVRKQTPPSPNLNTFVNASSVSTDEVLLWTWRPQLLFETKRVFATRLLVNEMLIGRPDPSQPSGGRRERRPGMAELWPVYLRDLAAAPPKLIFDASPGRSEWPIERIPQLVDFLSRYQPCQVVDDVCVYVRRD